MIQGDASNDVPGACRQRLWSNASKLLVSKTPLYEAVLQFSLLSCRHGRMPACKHSWAAPAYRKSFTIDTCPVVSVILYETQELVLSPLPSQPFYFEECIALVHSASSNGMRFPDRQSGRERVLAERGMRAGASAEEGQVQSAQKLANTDGVIGRQPPCSSYEQTK